MKQPFNNTQCPLRNDGIHKVPLHFRGTVPYETDALMEHMVASRPGAMTFLMAGSTVADWSVPVLARTLDGETCGYSQVGPHGLAALEKTNFIISVWSMLIIDNNQPICRIN